MILIPNDEIIIIDNFLDNPFLVRLKSLKQKFYTKLNHPNKEVIQNFPGKRTKELSEIDYNFFNYFVNKLIYFTDHNVNISKTSLTFSFLSRETPLNFHIDYWKSHSRSGVLYLNEKINTKYGTIVGNQTIDSKYNRLVIYNGLIPHCPTAAFGTNKFNSRMTLNLFY